MEKNLISKNDLSLPFALILIIAVSFLSGCNLNAKTDGSALPPHQSEAMSTTEAEATSSATYRAGVMQPFDRQMFDAAMADGKTVFLDFFASWCPTCRANKPIVEVALKGRDVVGFRANYDTDIDLKKEYSVISQSSYVVLKDGEILNRYVGALTPDKMDELLNS